MRQRVYAFVTVYRFTGKAVRHRGGHYPPVFFAGGKNNTPNTGTEWEISNDKIMQNTQMGLDKREKKRYTL